MDRLLIVILILAIILSLIIILTLIVSILFFLTVILIHNFSLNISTITNPHFNPNCITGLLFTHPYDSLIKHHHHCLRILDFLILLLLLLLLLIVSCDWSIIFHTVFSLLLLRGQLVGNLRLLVSGLLDRLFIINSFFYCFCWLFTAL